MSNTLKVKFFKSSPGPVIPVWDMAPYFLELSIFQVPHCFVQKERCNIFAPEFRHNESIVDEAIPVGKFYSVVIIQDVYPFKADFQVTYYFSIVLHMGKNMVFRSSCSNLHSGIYIQGYEMLRSLSQLTISSLRSKSLRSNM